MQKPKDFRKTWKLLSKGTMKQKSEAKLTVLILLRKLPEHRDLIIRACKQRLTTKNGMSDVEKIKSSLKNKAAKILFNKYLDLCSKMIDNCDIVGQVLTIPDAHKKKKKKIMELAISSSSNPEEIVSDFKQLDKITSGNLSKIVTKKDLKLVQRCLFKVKDSRLRLIEEIDELSLLVGSREDLFSIAPFLNNEI